MQKDNDKNATDPEAQPPGRGEGAPPSNTAPSNCKPPRILRTGIDSLYLSVPGFIYMDTDIKLKTLKTLAQGTAQEQALAVYPVLGHRFEVWAKGSGRFPYVLADNAYYFKFSGPGSRTLPLAYIQIRSAWLMGKGIHNACHEIVQILKKLGEVEGELQVSRADLHVDFVLDWNLGDPLLGQWVTRARRISEHSMDRVFSGFSIGLGGDISARLYDKTLEIRESGKDFLIPIWQMNGWSGEGTVYRLEFQI